MTYIDRLQPQIILTSPSGQVFNAKWAGDERSVDKEVGIFKTPGVAGVVTQDLNIGAMSYPLTIYFDGSDNDLESTRFMDALSESGTWVVIHPVKGEKILQPLSFSEAVQPVTSGNVTVISGEWVEVTGQQGVKSAAQLSAETIAQNEALAETTSNQLENIAELDTSDKVGKFKNAVDNVVAAYDLTIGVISDSVAEVQAQADSIKRGIDTVLDVVPLDVLSIAGQIQALVNLPNLVVTDLESKVDTYSRFADSILEFSPDTATTGAINTAAVQEIALTSALGAVGVASVVTDLPSRQSVINSLESNIALFTTITNGLDQIQALYLDQLIVNSYFSQSESFSDSARLIALSLAYLLESTYALAVEKKIILTKQSNPVMVAMAEYDGPGDNDSNIDLFYSSNNLTGQECYLLPVGKEVVVYR